MSRTKRDKINIHEIYNIYIKTLKCSTALLLSYKNTNDKAVVIYVSLRSILWDNISS